MKSPCSPGKHDWKL